MAYDPNTRGDVTNFEVKNVPDANLSEARLIAVWCTMPSGSDSPMPVRRRPASAARATTRQIPNPRWRIKET